MKKIFSITVILSILLMALSSINITFAEDNNARRYQQAQMLLDIGDYLTAAQVFESLGDYKDSADMYKKANELAGNTQNPSSSQNTTNSVADEVITKPDLISDRYRAGDVILFGRYEQDGFSSNGPEPIEWIIIETDGKSAKMITRYILDERRYNDAWGEECTWDTCSLRVWLNTEFYNTAFSKDEKTKIKLTNLIAKNNPDYNTDQGKGTKDKVFLLSIDEVHDLPDKGKVTYETPAACGQGNYDQLNYWWLRTTGERGYLASCYDSFHDTIDTAGFETFSDDANFTGVRPAIVIEL